MDIEVVECNGHDEASNPAQGSESGEMSLWARVQQLPEDLFKQVQNAYGRHMFPIEVRHYFAEWIELQPWDQIEHNPNYEMYARTLYDDLMKQLEAKINDLPMTQDCFLQKIGLQGVSQKLETQYASSTLNLVSDVKELLTVERQFVNQAENPCQGMEHAGASQTGINQQISQEIDVLQKNTQVTDNDLKVLQNKQESFIIQYQQSLNLNTQIQTLKSSSQNAQTIDMAKQLTKQKEETEKQLLSEVAVLVKAREDLAAKHQQTFQALEELQKKVVDRELISWKRKQQLSGNGATFDSQMLGTLQEWCEALAEMIWKNRQQLLQVQILTERLPIGSNELNEVLPELNQKITGLLSSLVTSTFILESQPPQVLKKEARFAATVRLLVGGKLNIHMTPPQVKATIISEAQAQGLLKNDSKAKDETSGEILNNAGTMEYHQNKGELSIAFKNMQLKRIKRADKKGSEAVTEEKFCVLFQSDFQIGNGELVFQVWTLSLPVVVTVHGNQECNALATVLWDNQFAEPGRTPFHVPDSVPWTEVMEMLDCKFKSMTGRGLSSDNKNYLASKVFASKCEDYSKKTITWSMFNKDTLPGRNFTFWEWFYAIEKVTKEHLKDQWNDGLIIGFVSKAQAQEWLLNKPNGTFLLRFSDSEIGGITIAWVADDPNKPGDRQVWNLAPYGAKDFSIRSLSNRIKDLPSLVCLFPNIPKDDVFKKYYTALPDRPLLHDGYVPTGLMATIGKNYENPQTPQAMNFSVMSPASMGHPNSPPSGPSSPQLVSSQMETIDDSEMEQVKNILLSSMDYGADDISDITTDGVLSELLSQFNTKSVATQ